MIADLINRACTIQSDTVTTDAYGNTIPSTPGSPVSTVGYFERKATEEHLVDRQTVVTDWKGWFLPAETITARSYVTVGAQKFQVVGDPWLVFNPREQVVHHIECDLVVVS